MEQYRSTIVVNNAIIKAEYERPLTEKEMRKLFKELCNSGLIERDLTSDNEGERQIALSFVNDLVAHFDWEGTEPLEVEVFRLPDVPYPPMWWAGDKVWFCAGKDTDGMVYAESCWFDAKLLSNPTE